MPSGEVESFGKEISMEGREGVPLSFRGEVRGGREGTPGSSAGVNWLPGAVGRCLVVR